MHLFLISVLFAVAAIGAAFFTGVAAGPALDRFRRQHPLMALLGFAATVGYAMGAGTVIGGISEFVVSGAAVAAGLLLCMLTGLSAGVALRLVLGYLARLVTRKPGRMRDGVVVLF